MRNLNRWRLRKGCAVSRELTQKELDKLMAVDNDYYSEAWESHLDPEFAEANRTVNAQLDKPQGSLWKPGEPYPGQQSYVSNIRGACVHGPTHAIDHHKFQMYVGKWYDVQDEAGKFDVAVNLTGTAIKREHIIPFPSLRKYESLGSAKIEVVLDWPDYGILEFPLEFYEELRDEIVKAGGRAVVFCVGGHGRTGTFFASMLVADLGWAPERAIKWVRERYCDRAIESKAQEQYIHRIGKQYLKRYKKYDTR
jgi:hypothetical protein